MSRSIITASYLAFTIFAVGCTARGGSSPEADAGTPGGGSDASVVDPNAVVESSKARLQFRGGEIYAAMLSSGLGIPREELCRELGLYDCAGEVHRISLLGVEPYRTGIIEPLENTVVSTPIAAERVALSACTQWARSGRATGERSALASGLYRQLLQRDPEERELAHLEQLYVSMAGEGADPKLDENWAAMSCFAIATTSEALFY